MLSAKDQLKAIAWKCEETGLSYGKLVSQFSTQELYQVYSDYEKMIAAKEKKQPSPKQERSFSSYNNTICKKRKVK